MWRGAAPPRGRAKLRRPLEGLVNVMTVQLTSMHNQAVRVIERHVDPSTYVTLVTADAGIPMDAIVASASL